MNTKKFYVSLSLFCLAFTGVQTAFAQSGSDFNQELNQRLSHAQESARQVRTKQGWGLFAMGGVTAASTLFISTDTSTRLIVGGILAGGGIFHLLKPTSNEKKIAEYLGNGSTNVESGEQVFREVAAEAKRERLMGGSLWCAFGVAEMISSNHSENSKEDRDLRLFLGAALTGVGLYWLLGESPMERAMGDYQAWKNGRSSKLSVMPTVGIDPVSKSPLLGMNVNL